VRVGEHPLLAFLPHSFEHAPLPLPRMYRRWPSLLGVVDDAGTARYNVHAIRTASFDTTSRLLRALRVIGRTSRNQPEIPMLAIIAAWTILTDAPLPRIALEQVYVHLAMWGVF